MSLGLLVIRDNFNTHVLSPRFKHHKKMIMKEYKKGIKPQRSRKLGRSQRNAKADRGTGWFCRLEGATSSQRWRAVCGRDRPSEASQPTTTEQVPLKKGW